MGAAPSTPDLLVKDPTLLSASAARSDGESATPLWLLRLLHVAKLLGMHPDDIGKNMVLTSTYIVLNLVALALIHECAKLAGFSALCSFRAALFMYVQYAGAIVDWCTLIKANRWRVAELPIVWSPQQRDDMAVLALSQSLKDIPFRASAWFVGTVIPSSLWAMRLGGDGAAVYVVLAVMLMTPMAALHLFFDALTSSFWTNYSNEAQRELRERLLVRKELSLDAALRIHASVNARRRTLASLYANFLPAYFGSWWISEAILVHDGVLRPWGGWPMMLLYVMNVVSLVGVIRPYLEANYWTDTLAREVVESTQLGWSARERTDFVMHLKVSKVEYTVSGYPMTGSFGTTICVAVFAMWLYVYEAQAFNDWPGFSFDMSCGVEVHIT